MTKKLFGFLLLSVISLAVFAAGHKPADIPMVHLHDKTKYACNPDGVLSDAAIARIDSTLSWLEANKGIQTILVVIRKMENEDSFSFALELAQLHKPGHKEKNTGLVILLSTEDRQYTILTGRGEIHSGTFTVTFSAYEPYGFMTYKQIDDGVDLKGAEIYSGILPAEQMPELISETSTSGLIYNCGTQPCNTLIQIGGTGTDIVISNETNGTFCSLLSLPESGYLEIDSRLGKVTLVHNEQRDVFFEYHNEGYLTLAPYLPKQFNVGVEYKNGNATVSFYELTSLENYLGKYIYLEEAWHKIVSVSEEDGTAELDTAMTTNGATLTKIVTMNEIRITGTGMTLNKLSIDYTPVIV